MELTKRKLGLMLSTAPEHSNLDTAVGLDTGAGLDFPEDVDN